MHSVPDSPLWVSLLQQLRLNAPWIRSKLGHLPLAACTHTLPAVSEHVFHVHHQTTDQRLLWPRGCDRQLSLGVLRPYFVTCYPAKDVPPRHPAGQAKAPHQAPLNRAEFWSRFSCLWSLSSGFFFFASFGNPKKRKHPISTRHRLFWKGFLGCLAERRRGSASASQVTDQLLNCHKFRPISHS